MPIVTNQGGIDESRTRWTTHWCNVDLVPRHGAGEASATELPFGCGLQMICDHLEFSCRHSTRRHEEGLADDTSVGHLDRHPSPTQHHQPRPKLTQKSRGRTYMAVSRWVLRSRRWSRTAWRAVAAALRSIAAWFVATSVTSSSTWMPARRGRRGAGVGVRIRGAGRAAGVGARTSGAGRT